MRTPAWVTPRSIGAVVAGLSLALLLVPGLPWAALGLEGVALAFWLWARAESDPAEPLARWAWLRRPAAAMWLAAGLTLVLPVRHTAFVDLGSAVPQLAAPALRDPLLFPRALRAFCVLWAGLELLAALPLSRPFPDLPGPLPKSGPWLTALLPAAGFFVLWSQAAVWRDAPFVQETAAVLLATSAALAVLRAYSRRSLTASLRWLAVFDSALASLLVTLDVVPGEVAALLWLGAAGGRMVALAAELRGQSMRRGATVTALWRAAGWASGATLAWPLLVAVGFADRRFHPLEFVIIGAPVALAASLSLRRVTEAPERRARRRVDARSILSRVGAFAVLVTGPVALLFAWWRGFDASWPGAAIALLPAMLGWWPVRAREVAADDAAGDPGAARDFALSAFRTVVAFEQRLAGSLARLARGLGAPARDLHSGDAQEYLLFLVGVSVLALLLPLLR